MVTFINDKWTDYKDEFTDEQKWDAMNTSRPESTTQDIDLALMLSGSRLNIAANDTTEIAFAVLAAENLYELNLVADKAVSLYNEQSYIVPEDTTNVPETREQRALIYPSPAVSTIYIDNQQPISMVRIYNANGALEIESKCSTATTSIDISHFSNGLYIVEIVSADGWTEHRLVVK